MGVGCIIRNSMGNFLAALTMKKEGTSTPLIAEAVALREGILFLKNLELQNVEIEVDCKQLAMMINSEEGYSPLDLPLASDILVLMQTFHGCVLRWCPRLNNQAADMIAGSLAGRLEKNTCRSWFHDPPSELLPVLRAETMRSKTDYCF